MLGEALQVALQVVEILDELGIRYELGGSLASSLHGVPRQTRDVDLVVDLPMSKVGALVARLEKDFYVDAERARRAVNRRASFNIVHLASAMKIDLFVQGTGVFDRIEFERRAPHSVGGFSRSLMVSSAEDVVLRKLLWYRIGGEVSDRQWSDVQGVLLAQGERLDREYLARWADNLHVDDLLERALAEANR